MKKKSPAFQFYPKDYLSDEKVMLLSPAEEGFYWRAICYCWLEGSIPASPESLARLLGKGCTTNDSVAIQKLFRVCEKNSDRMIHLRLAKDRKLQQEKSKERSRAGKNGAKARWDKGLPSLPQPSQPDGSAIGLPMAKNSTPTPTPTPTPTALDLSIYTLPESAPPSLQTALQNWGKLQKQKYNRTVSQLEVDAMLVSWSPRFTELEKAVIYSTANGWKNVREGNGQIAPAINGAPPYIQKKSAQQLKDDRIKALHAKFKAEEEGRLHGKIGND